MTPLGGNNVVGRSTDKQMSSVRSPNILIPTTLLEVRIDHDVNVYVNECNSISILQHFLAPIAYIIHSLYIVVVIAYLGIRLFTRYHVA